MDWLLYQLFNLHPWCIKEVYESYPVIYELGATKLKKTDCKITKYDKLKENQLKDEEMQQLTLQTQR